jgi:hypothetical protein
MEKIQPREETGRVLGVAAGLWGAVIGIATLEGAPARFEGTSLALLVAFVSVFAVASYLLDPQLRGYAARMDFPRAAVLAIGLSAACAASLALGSVAFAMFFAPLAALAIATATLRPRRRFMAKPAAPAKSPGANPAAT